MSYDLAIDIYHGNGAVDMAAAKAAGVRWVWVKVTQGTGFVDPLGSTHLSDALGVGLLRGAYHFGEASGGGAQGDFFLRHLYGVDNVALDFESYEDPPGSGLFKKMQDQQARDFAVVVNGQPGLGTKAVYGLESDVHRLLGYKEFASWVGWVAKYNPAPPGEPWEFWQYGSLIIKGTTVDANHWKGGGVSVQDVLDAFGFDTTDAAKGAGSVLEGAWDALRYRDSIPADPVRAASMALFKALMTGSGGGTLPSHSHSTPAGQTGDVVKP